MQQIGTKWRTSGIEGVPIGKLRQRWQSHEFALVQPGERCIDHVLRRHHDVVRQISDRHARKVPELGYRGTRQDGLDTDALVGELVMQELKRLDKIAYIRFASVYKNFEDLAEFQEAIAEVGQPRK